MIASQPKPKALVSQQFIDALIAAGGPIAKANDLPVAAMVACAVGESGGTSDIYHLTHCPFNLQKPDHFTWVRCETKMIRTNTATDARGNNIKPMYAPFCVAKGLSEPQFLADATRIWCEWVLGWPNPGPRERLLSKRSDPEAFARLLPLVGFGEAAKAEQNGARFVQVLKDQNLIERCKHVQPDPDGKRTLPLPAWLPGWWVVTWRGQAFYYHFSTDFHVHWTQVPPLSGAMPPLVVTDSARYRIEPGRRLVIRWKATNSEETFSAPLENKPMAMEGRWNGSEQLLATRLPRK